MAGIKEECGVFGIYDLDGGNVVPSIYYGLTSLQHRGQESCGLAVSDTKGERGNVKFHKDLGLVSEVLRQDVVRKYEGDIGIGHVRYSTTGASVAENAQPLVLSYVKGTLALAHNGNLVNTPELKWELIQNGAIFHTTTDSEVIAFHIARERVHSKTVEEAVLKTAKKSVHNIWTELHCRHPGHRFQRRRTLLLFQPSDFLRFYSNVLLSGRFQIQKILSCRHEQLFVT